jgi:hypothetical protein
MCNEFASYGIFVEFRVQAFFPLIAKLLLSSQGSRER